MSRYREVYTEDKGESYAIIAIPKKGRLYEQCVKLLEGADLKYDRPSRVDVATCRDFPITLVFLPASDIPSYVGEGNCDLGITGIDVVEESEEEVDIALKLGFGKCKLCVQAPIKSEIKSPKDLVGKRIVTSFPNLTKKYFNNLGNDETKIRYVSGSVEAACGLGLADAVVDLVETGTTMKAAGLEKISDVLETEAAIIASKKEKNNKDLINLILKRIQGYMTATNYMMISYNVERDLLAAALQITPGKRGPTVSALDTKEGEAEAVAVSALVNRKESSKIMDGLEKVGATDILLFPISNSRM